MKDDKSYTRHYLIKTICHINKTIGIFAKHWQTLICVFFLNLNKIAGFGTYSDYILISKNKNKLFSTMLKIHKIWFQNLILR